MEEKKFFKSGFNEKEIIKKSKEKFPLSKEKEEILRERIVEKVREILEDVDSDTYHTTTSSLKFQNLNKISDLLKKYLIEAIETDDVFGTLKKVITETKDQAMIDAFHDLLVKFKIKTLKDIEK